MSYDVSVEELKTLMECRHAEAKERIDSEYGGITGLCQKLRTDPVNGLPNSADEIAQRRAAFGPNEIPPAPSKSFFRLVWEAVQVSDHDQIEPLDEYSNDRRMI